MRLRVQVKGIKKRARFHKMKEDRLSFHNSDVADM